MWTHSMHNQGQKVGKEFMDIVAKQISWVKKCILVKEKKNILQLKSTNKQTQESLRVKYLE